MFALKFSIFANHCVEHLKMNHCASFIQIRTTKPLKMTVLRFSRLRLMSGLCIFKIHEKCKVTLPENSLEL